MMNEYVKRLDICAGIREKKLYITERMAAARHNIGSNESVMYFGYKMKYPTFEEVIVPNTREIPVDQNFNVRVMHINGKALLVY